MTKKRRKLQKRVINLVYDGQLDLKSFNFTNSILNLLTICQLVFSANLDEKMVMWIPSQRWLNRWMAGAHVDSGDQNGAVFHN